MVHSGNLGNDCADHAAALGTLGFTSSHNVTTRLMQLRVLMAVTALLRSGNGYGAFERILCLFSNIGFSIVFTIEFIMLLCIYVPYGRLCFLLSAFSLFGGSCFLEQVMDRFSSSASTVPSIDDCFQHNMWTPQLELLFLEQANGIFASFLMEIDLDMIALSCHFALLLLFYKEGMYDSA